MPRKRPRIGKSTTDPDQWNNDPPQGGEIIIRYDKSIEDYQAYFGEGQEVKVKLATLLQANADVAVNGWAGYAQPDELKAIPRADAGDELAPSDYTVSWEHEHECWKGIDSDSGDPTGRVSGKHTHKGNWAEMLVMANDETGTTRVYVVHAH